MLNRDSERGREGVESMKPAEILKYVAKLGEDFTRIAHEIQAMLAEAEEKGIPVDLSANETLQKFRPRGEHEIDLVRWRADLGLVQIDLLKQGVKMTAEDLAKRLEKMGMENDKIQSDSSDILSA